MKSSKTPDSLKKMYDQTAFGIAGKNIKELWYTKRRLIYLDLAITTIVSSLLGGYLYLLIAGSKYNFSILLALVYGIIKVPWLTIILFIVINKFTYQYLSALSKHTLNDTDRNYAGSTQGYKGTDHRMTDEEKKLYLTCGDYATQTDIILGCEPGNIDMLYSLKRGYGINGNIIIIGAPGCGKTRSFNIPFIMQKIRVGESLVITDPKLEIYRYTAAMLKANGYVVKILDFRPSHSLHTDTCNYMSALGNNIFQSQSFSKTVMENTSDGKANDFWTNSEFNLFMGICIFVKTNKIGIPKTMGGIYQYLYNHTVDEFENECYSLPDSHPAMPYLKTFTNSDKTVKGNTYAGLQIRLSALADPLVQNIVGKEDIDLTLPGRQKCAYFISSPDTDQSRSYLVALFFTILYNSLIDFADDQDNGCLPVKVNMVLEEFKNTGRIPYFPEKISTVRSRGIDSIITLQGVEQLEIMYPNNEYESIMNACDTHIFYKTNNNINAKYFAESSGTQTTEETDISYEESAGDLLKIHPRYKVRQSHGERHVYTQGEIRRLNRNHVLVYITQAPVVELEKVDFSKHPMCKEIRPWVARYHAPKWILDMSENDRKKYHVYDECYKKESIKDIELCTPEDFMEPWSEEKDAALKARIAMQSQRNAVHRNNTQRYSSSKKQSSNDANDTQASIPTKNTISAFKEKVKM